MSPVYMDTNNNVVHDLNTLNTFKDTLANYLRTRYGINMQHGTIQYERVNISTSTCMSTNYRTCNIMRLNFTLTIDTQKNVCASP